MYTQFIVHWPKNENVSIVRTRIFKSFSLLWLPNRGKTPANVDRVKLFAAKALAA